MDYGIDLSHYNTVNDWNAVRGNNITFALCKITEGTTFVDQDAGGHLSGARGVGIHGGGYHFARPGSVVDQVTHFVNTGTPLGIFEPGSLTPVLDVEVSGVGDAFIAEWIRVIRERTGVKRVMVYANLNFWTNVLHPDQWAGDGVYLWIARYNGDPGNPGWAHPRLALHQHSDKGSVPGIPGAVDRNATIVPFGLADLLN
ncbi:glycosyl hydrolase family 25 [Herbihabitans rhizosphaerae]|uniref:Glycosyl hydrolase family 25 n=1 Tax=Herbihabitans rhizosphaerae TaxID=1872711 RepID=A0A4Q7KLF3_9PSEU|nr:glycoside hydrolase family 25 protein [Herbihabitans rhizosphaerae]RZS37459.1 glycosyl hydrolase family 25 [Herbihabitans rhizosphaerae]